MKCFKCGCELSEKDFCTSCGENVKLYKKINKISNMHFNDGLAKANVRDLSGAIVSLHQSLKLNKNNTKARNLLGLVYYEMGEVVAALSEWVISKNIENSKNIAGDYIKAIQSNPNRLETINQTIKKYNQALVYCKQESEDLAIIQLKKVLSLNPNLVTGHQLLALLFMKHEEYDKANKELGKALKIDTSNTTTLRYCHELELMFEKPVASNSQKNRVNENRVSYKSGNETIIQPTVFRENTGMSTVVNILIGLVVGAALTGFLILPAKINSINNEAKQTIMDYNSQISAKTATVTDLEAQLETSQSDLKEKTAELEQYVGDTGVVDNYEMLFTAMKAYNKNDILAAYDALEGIDSEVLKADSLNIYNTLNDNVLATAATTLYNTGYAAYKADDYDIAIENLLKVVKLDETNGNALYVLGRAYQKNGNQETANQYFDLVIERFPNTDWAANALTNKH
ncbi:MAG: tetratricopeptide repeat protein [Lachnotalea sp.]